jgi:hypothetical protein
MRPPVRPLPGRPPDKESSPRVTGWAMIKGAAVDGNRARSEDGGREGAARLAVIAPPAEGACWMGDPGGPLHRHPPRDPPSSGAADGAARHQDHRRRPPRQCSVRPVPMEPRPR